MQPRIKQLTLSDLILRRKGTVVFRLALAAFGIALRLFFRRIETVNADVIPKGTGVIFVLNHPNGLIDPALVFVALPRQISFLAKSTLFRMPVISFLLKTVEALPLYRRIDSGEDVSKNQRTFQLCRDLLRRGGSIALFPEGVSHSSPKLLPAKTGAARIALGTAAAGDGLDLKIVPVGLFYTSKNTFRSEALLHFGEPFGVGRVEPGPDGEPNREDVRRLTARIEAELRAVTLNAESDADIAAAAAAERILATAAANERLGEKFEFLQKFVAGSDAPENRDLAERVAEFDTKLNEIGLLPEHLSLAQLSPRTIVRQALLQTWALILVAPLSIPGILLHYPAYRLCGVIARVYARHGADDVESTAKVLAGMLFVPATWLLAAAAAWYFWDWRIALLSLPLAVAAGYGALYTQERSADLKGWARAIGIFLARKEYFLRLFVERRELQHELIRLDQ
jgi:glycerol-3-phosphate O-acyltransferase / dihydroxyacetone phosphate acyltransferase